MGSTGVNWLESWSWLSWERKEWSILGLASKRAAPWAREPLFQESFCNLSDSLTIKHLPLNAHDRLEVKKADIPCRFMVGSLLCVTLGSENKL